MNSSNIIMVFSLVDRTLGRDFASLTCVEFPVLAALVIGLFRASLCLSRYLFVCRLFGCFFFFLEYQFWL